MSGSWERERRLDMIECLLAGGGLRRCHLMKIFGVSVAQASKDIRDYIAAYPGQLSYDRSSKYYYASTAFARPRKTTWRTSEAFLQFPDLQ